ncbi:uncharacterized protein A1O9_12166 [Exophiala aquamarina CBS 119918]|uniref:Uncharacterized protein n=1 Tax=Exophiala aquamarina CBS 119918 TaxID=1182545 RepID=A0A072NVE9_9EURO|nr:uncharacterized protein A1O9_12166 [Exophiala aquamarina CBS 119918]KEF51829.1 hypothetical protein A1O9_12166 [Exophiala aquamarina CBS 119918]
MPFGSLRNRVGGKASNPQSGDSPTKSHQRGRSITMPSITPRKSWTSLFDSYKRGRFTVINVSPVKVLPDALEEDLYPQYDPTNPDHDPERANATSPQQKSLRGRRTPSPHPQKRTSGARPPKLHRRNRSQTSLKEAEVPKTFLESLADAIRAPASFFYKDTKKSPVINDDTAKDVTSSLVATPKSARTSPKKSVTFQPGASFMESGQRSSPIDIPKPAPSLAPVQLAFTPFAHGFASELRDSILTARLPETQILKSSPELHYALGAAQLRDHFVEIETQIQPQGSHVDLPTPSETNSSIEDPFADPSDATKQGKTQEMLTGYDDRFQSRNLTTVTSTNIAIDRNFVSNDEKVQDLPPDLTATTSSSLTTNRRGVINTTKGSAHPSGHCGRESEASESISSDSGLLGPTPSTMKDSGTSKHCGERQSTVSKLMSGSRALDAPLERYDADHELSEEPKSQAHDSQHLRSPVGSQKWIDNPTHEDIRQKFKVYSAHKGPQRKQETETTAMETPRQGSVQSAPCNAAIATLPTTLSNSRRLSVEDLDLVADLGKAGTENPSSQVRDMNIPSPPKNLLSDSNNSQTFPWTAELTLRSAKSPLKKKMSPPESILECTDNSLDLSSSQDIVKLQGNVWSTLEDTFIEGSLVGSEVDCPTIRDPGLSSKSIAIQTPSPARIPLPASSHPGLERAKNYVDQCNWCPFKEYKFSYAATAAIEMNSSSFRRFLGLQGCFYAFWELCKLPDSTKPSRDTRGLASSEIDTLFDEIKQATLLPEPGRSALLKAFKAILASDDLEFYALGNRPMSSESIETIDAPSGPRHSEEGILRTQLDNLLLRMKDEGVAVESDAEPWLERHANSSHTRRAASHTRDEALSRPEQIGSASEEEKFEKVSKVLENSKLKLKGEFKGFTYDKSYSLREQWLLTSPYLRCYMRTDHICLTGIQRRETTESQRSLLPGRRRSMWSDKSQSGASTSATSTMDALEEDEKFCQGIV